MEKPSPRLLIILNRFVIGGQAVDTFPLAWHLQKHFEILVLCGEKEEDEIEPTFLLKQYPGIKLVKIKGLKRSINPVVDVQAFFRIVKQIRRFDPHIVHTHGAKPGLFGRIAAFFCRVPVKVHTFHGHLFHSYYSRSLTTAIKWVERLMAKLTTGFIVLSNAQFNDLVSIYKIIPLIKCKIIPLGVVQQRETETVMLRNTFRERYCLNENDVAIGIIGRIVPIKNHAFFIQVIQKLLAANPLHPPAFFIVGDGELKAALEQQLKALTIPYSTNILSAGCRVIFTSWLSNIPQVMSGLDIVALTSLNEGTPLSLIEAQAHGTPVIATNVGGVRDSMLNGQTGYMVDNGNLEGFVQKMQILLVNKNLRQKMGENGIGFAAEKFSKQKEVEATCNLYFTLLKQKGGLLSPI